jgi:outer membrane protein OmpA-like peptidoglycan-associated protein
MAISTVAFTQEKKYKITKISTQNSDVWGAIPTVKGEIIFVENTAGAKNDAYSSRLIIMDKNHKESVLTSFEQYQRVGSPYISDDGREFYFAVSGTAHSNIVNNIFKSGTTYYPLQLMMFENTDKEWSHPVEFQYNSDKHSTADPCLSPDGTYLYFASDKKGGYGGTDIYRCKRNADSSWSEPENLGININTKENERFPRFDSKGNLYFSSTANTNGSLDLFVCKPDGNSFKAPVKMDKPFNSEGDDFAISFIDENSGYISSNRDGGIDHIYLFESEIIRKAEPVKTDTVGKPVEVIDKIKVTDTVKKIEIAKTPDVMLSDLLKKGKLQYINFDFDKWRITDKHIPALKDLINFMKRYQTVTIEVAGHTDCTGKSDYNLKLSNKRATSVRDYLVTNGIDSNRIVVKEFGSANPLIDCEKSKTEIANETNRRVEYRVIKY